MQQHRFFRPLVIGVLSLACGVQGAWAAFQQRDSHLGANTSVFDTLSGNTWLRLDLSYNLSYEFVTANCEPGGLFNGFRVAAGEELLTLFRNGEFDIDGGPAGPHTLAREAANANFAAVFGGVATPGGGAALRGRYDLAFTPFQQALATAQYTPGSVGFAADSVFSPDGWVDTQSPTVGTWMVAAPVPEPETYALMFMGLLAVGAAHRRAAKRATPQV